MSESTTTLDLPIPDLLARRIADATGEALDILDRFEAVLRRTTRLDCALDAFALDGIDDVYEEDRVRALWMERSGLDDLFTIVALVQSAATQFTGSVSEEWSRAQRLQMAEAVREDLEDRRALLLEAGR